MPRHPSFAATAGSLSDNVYSALARRARNKKERVFPLHVGDTWREPHPGARAEAQLTADHPHLHTYAPVQGEPALLAAICERLATRGGYDVARECVQVMSGATVGLSVTCQTLLEPGDEVIILAPYWPLIRGIVASRGAVAVEVPFWDRLGDEDFDPEAAISGAITERTAALYVNTPNNPTGRILPAPVGDALARLAVTHDLWVLADEAYEDLWLGDAPPSPFWARADLRGRLVACHTLSKSYGLAGARVGYTHGPEAVMAAVRGVQTFQVYCAARPMQFAAIAALREADEWLAETRAAYREAGRLAADSLGLPHPEGSTFLFFDARPYFAAGEQLMDFLGRCLDAGVLLTPGGASGRDYQTWLRLCFTAVPPQDLAIALEQLRPLFEPRR